MSVKLASWRTRLVAATIAALAGLAGSCTWDFLDGDGDQPAPIYHYTYDYDAQQRVATAYCWNEDDDLQWYERYAWDDDGNKTMARRFGGDDVLRHTWRWAWDGGLKTIEAYYGADDLLRWYDHLVYDGGLLAGLYEYDGGGALEWYERYDYSPTGRQTSAARFDGGSALVGVTASEYDAADLLVVERSYGADGLLVALVTREYDAEGRPTRGVTWGWTGASASRAASVRGIAPTGAPRAFAAEPALPEPPVPPEAPTVTLTDRDLDVTARRFWFYDAWGVTDVTTTAAWMPTSIARQDERLEESVTVTLGYDASGRVQSKTTRYGDVEALAVSLTYRDDSGTFVSRIRTSGAAMLVPLNFDLSYDDAGLPAQVMIGYDTTTLFTLTYEYDAADPLVHTISVEDGDGELYGSYVFTLAADWRSARIDVYTDAAHTAYNGCYLIAYDEGRRAVSFTACDSAGNPVSAFEYGYEDLQGLGEQALMVAESKLGFDLGEAGDVSAVLQEIQAGDFDFTMLLRVRSAEDVARLLL